MRRILILSSNDTYTLSSTCASLKTPSMPAMLCNVPYANVPVLKKKMLAPKKLSHRLLYALKKADRNYLTRKYSGYRRYGTPERRRSLVLEVAS
jgi:hypothetical protein